MACDMPGPWDAERAILYVNMQWQSCGSRVAVVWQSSGNRVAVEQYRSGSNKLCCKVRSIREVVGIMSRRMCARTKATDLHRPSSYIPHGLSFERRKLNVNRQKTSDVCGQIDFGDRRMAFDVKYTISSRLPHDCHCKMAYIWNERGTTANDCHTTATRLPL